MTLESDAVLVTGGAGFIGSNLVRWLLGNTDRTVVVLDLLTYAGNLESLEDTVLKHGPDGDGRLYFVRGDINDGSLVSSLLAGEAVELVTGRQVPQSDALLHLAAESHVDRSILGPAQFVATNVQGTLVLLECVRRELERRPRDFRFVNVSTDEVYGSLGAADPGFTERTPLAPNSPYSASKAGADCLVRAYAETFAVPAVTMRCSNNYGPYQFPEKLIPLMITRALGDLELPVYGDGQNVRDWLFVDDHAAAIWTVCVRGRVGEVYNVGGESEMRNIDLVRLLLRLLGKPESLIRFVPDRLGHDRRYAMDITKIRSDLGWAPTKAVEDGLAETVRWYVDNRTWWNRILTEAYRTSHLLYLSTP